MAIAGLKPPSTTPTQKPVETEFQIGFRKFLDDCQSYLNLMQIGATEDQFQSSAADLRQSLSKLRPQNQDDSNAMIDGSTLIQKMEQATRYRPPKPFDDSTLALKLYGNPYQVTKARELQEGINADKVAGQELLSEIATLFKKLKGK